jgi:hypothetical protein
MATIAVTGHVVAREGTKPAAENRITELVRPNKQLRGRRRNGIEPIPACA